MALTACKVDGRPGWAHAKDAACNTYTDGDTASEKRAKMRAMKQAMVKNGNVPKGYEDKADNDLEQEVYALFSDTALETVTLKSVEILSEGGPYFGQGSPDGGDFFTADDIAEFAANNTLLASQVKAPNKVGHSSKQKLLENSGLTDGEKPAAGWLTNFAVKKRGGVAKLVVDIEDIPAKLGKLIKAKSFRTRSVEMASVTSQDPETQGQKFKVISGLAWLGAKAPAVKTLDDAIALFSEDEDATAEELLKADAAPDAPTAANSHDGYTLTSATTTNGMILFEDWRCVDYGEGDVVWDPKDSFEATRCAVQDSLATLVPAGMSSPSFWVRDIADGKALVSKYANGSTEYWVVPFKRDTDGGVELSDADKWTEAREAWVETSAAYDDQFDNAGTTFERSRDTSTMSKVSEHVKSLPAEQVKALAESFGIEATEEDAQREALTAKFSELAETPTPDPSEPKPDDEPPTEPVTTEPDVKLQAELEVLKAKAERGDRAFEQMRTDRIDATLKQAVKDGKLDPAKVDAWRGFCEKDEENSFAMLSEMPVNEDFLKVSGSDDDGIDTEGAADKQYEEWAAYSGIDVEEKS